MVSKAELPELEKLIAALDAMQPDTFNGLLRELLPKIRQKRALGVSYKKIADGLTRKGLPVTERQLASAMYLDKKRQAKLRSTAKMPSNGQDSRVRKSAVTLSDAAGSNGAIVPTGEPPIGKDGQVDVDELRRQRLERKQKTHEDRSD